MKRRDDLRRKNVLLRRLHDEAAGALLVRVIGPADIVCGRQLLALVGRWLVDTKDERPLCLCCDFEWSLQDGLLPLHFVAVVPWGVQAATPYAAVRVVRALHGPSRSRSARHGGAESGLARRADGRSAASCAGGRAMTRSRWRAADITAARDEATIITVLTAQSRTGKRYSLRDGVLEKTSVATAKGRAVGVPVDTAQMVDPVHPVPGAPAMTIDIDADAFLAQIFDSCEGSVGISNWDLGKWTRRWRPGSDLVKGFAYACISTTGNDPPKYEHSPAGALSRSHDNLVRTYAIILDDVGTAEKSKVAPERIKLRPSWRLETSPLNFQYGYIIEQGIHPDDANALIKTLIKAGLSDRGAGGANRLMRLPGSVKNGFAARLREWNPELRYSRTDIAAGLGVTPERVQ